MVGRSTPSATFPRKPGETLATSYIWFSWGWNLTIGGRCQQLGAGVVEVRIHDDAEYRVFYVAKYAEAVYVLHALGKKSRKTTQRDIDLGRKRYKELQAWRRDGGR